MGNSREACRLRLGKLCDVLIRYNILGNANIEVTSVTSDSRQVKPGSLFIALCGYTVDGHDFIAQAVAAGASAILCERPLPGIAAAQVVVPNTRRASAILADRFHDHPSQHIRVIGVTGTNGKTTVTHLIEQVLTRAGHRTGLLGTIGKRIGGHHDDAVNTTPEAVELQANLAEMRDADCAYCAMEVSSHALELERVAGTRFRLAVFTNLTQDHLDFHGTMAQYLAAKGKLFARLGNSFMAEAQDFSYAILNADDDATPYLHNQTVVECLTYGIDHAADVRARDLEIQASGVRFTVDTFAGTTSVVLQLTGRFNVYNALAAITVGLIESVPLTVITEALADVSGVPGRLEHVNVGQDFSVLVDYAHTPDSLENALDTVREFAGGRVITVIGCGGDRDATKRPLMAKAAVVRSDWTILTSDNPRTEDPERILDDMEAGCRDAVVEPVCYERITSRSHAIHRAIELAKPGDIVLIAGKGHETYQMVGKAKLPFDDRAVAREAIVQRSARRG